VLRDGIMSVMPEYRMNPRGGTPFGPEAVDARNASTRRTMQVEGQRSFDALRERQAQQDSVRGSAALDADIADTCARADRLNSMNASCGNARHSDADALRAQLESARAEADRMRIASSMKEADEKASSLRRGTSFGPLLECPEELGGHVEASAQRLSEERQALARRKVQVREDIGNAHLEADERGSIEGQLSVHRGTAGAEEAPLAADGGVLSARDRGGTSFGPLQNNGSQLQAQLAASHQRISEERQALAKIRVERRAAMMAM